jgi:hypothetical protein
MLQYKFAWNDFFSGSPSQTLNRYQYTSSQTVSASSVYVSNCLFNKCTISSGNGGALSCSTSVTILFVESSSFFSCKTNSGQAGAIYFQNSNALNCVLYAVCGYDCISTNTGIFARTSINNAASNKNYVNYTSVTRCVTSASGSECTLYIYYGKVHCPSVNVSMNKCPRFSGIIYTTFVDSNSVTSLMSYSTFAYNNDPQRSCIWCNSGNANYEIKCCNIFRNSQASSSYGTIFARGNLMIKDSCILENNANCIFYQEYDSCTITLSNCTVDSTSHYKSLVMQNTVTKSFINALNHMSTQNCHSEYDSVGTLTHNPYVSPSHTIMIRYTCKNQARISDSFPLNCLFIFTFIHTSPFYYSRCD